MVPTAPHAGRETYEQLNARYGDPSKRTGGAQQIVKEELLAHAEQGFQMFFVRKTNVYER